MKRLIFSRCGKFLMVPAIALIILMGAMTAHAQSATAAMEVKKAGDFEHGLVVVIGCGDDACASMVADLAVGGHILVHGIALNDADLERARKAIITADVAGWAMVEKLPLHPLPYRDNLVDGIVVADPVVAAAAGYTTAEAMRVLAPYGRLCVKNGATWAVTTKPMPVAMDEWTHIYHGPDANRDASKDTVIKPPFGYKWNAGLPFNICNPKSSGDAWSNTRGMVMAGGRCFALTSAAIENLPAAYFMKHPPIDEYLVARNAFNGLLLWSKKIGHTSYGGLMSLNYAPLVATGDYVYATSEDGKLLILKAATGEAAHQLDTTFPPGRFLVDQGVLVSANWKGGTNLGSLEMLDRRRHDYAVDAGTVEAFDAVTGERLWKLDKLATSICSLNGTLYMITREGADKYEEIKVDPRRKQDDPTTLPARLSQSVLAVDLRTGTPRQLAAVDKSGARSQMIAAKDITVNKISIAIDAGGTGPVTISPDADFSLASVAGKLVLNGSRGCVPTFAVNGMSLNNRGGEFRANNKTAIYLGVRGSCVVGMIPSYGALYIPQNWCACVPSQIPGLICLGAIWHEPTAEEMEAGVIPEKGPEFAKNRDQPSTAGTTDWPMYRKDATRSNSTDSDLPPSLDILWSQTVAKAPSGPVADTWKDDLAGPLTAPVAAADIVVVADRNRQVVIGLDAKNGGEKWCLTAGGMIDTSPTLYHGLCLFGSHDGYLYAYDLSTGGFAWRTRIAPFEERMVSYGRVESPWPVIGSVVAYNNLVYASAGKSQGSDGGLIARAINADTGEVRWSKALARASTIKTDTIDLKRDNARNVRPNDIMFQVGNAIQLTLARLDLATGEFLPNIQMEQEKFADTLAAYKRDKKDASALKAPEDREIAPRPGVSGLICWDWTKLGERKHAMAFGSVVGDQISWGKQYVCALSHLGQSVQLVPRDKVKTILEKYQTILNGQNDAKDYSWSQNLPAGYQGTSVIVCHNGIVIGGGVYAANGSSRGFVRTMSFDRTGPAVERLFDAPLAFNGIAVASGKIYASFDNGTVVCLGK